MDISQRRKEADQRLHLDMQPHGMCYLNTRMGYDDRSIGPYKSPTIYTCGICAESSWDARPLEERGDHLKPTHELSQDVKYLLKLNHRKG